MLGSLYYVLCIKYSVLYFPQKKNFHMHNKKLRCLSAATINNERVYQSCFVVLSWDDLLMIRQDQIWVAATARRLAHHICYIWLRNDSPFLCTFGGIFKLWGFIDLFSKHSRALIKDQIWVAHLVHLASNHYSIFLFLVGSESCGFVDQFLKYRRRSPFWHISPNTTQEISSRSKLDLKLFLVTHQLMTYTCWIAIYNMSTSLLSWRDIVTLALSKN